MTRSARDLSATAELLVFTVAELVAVFAALYVG